MVTLANQHVWEQAPLPFLALDREGRIAGVNGLWEELTGYSIDESIGRPFAEMVPKDHLRDFEGSFRRLSETGELDGIDCFVTCRDGRVLDVRVFGRSGDADRSECLLVDITGFRQTERELTESEERFRNLFELEPTPILIHDGARTLIANQACARFLGYGSPEELMGMPVADLVHPGDRPAVAERVRRMMAGDWTAPPRTERFLRRDGTVVSGETIASPVVLDGKRVVHVIAVDLSERLDAERALAESESRYRALFEFSGDAIIVHDGCVVQFGNRSAVAVFGFPEGSEVAGIALMDYVHPESVEPVGQRIEMLLSGQAQDKPMELHLYRADGSDWYAEAFSVVLSIDGETVVQTTFRDLTERKRVEGELANYRSRLEELLAERTESLERVRQELGAVTAVVSRTVEMRDPYTAGHQRRVATLARAIALKLDMDLTDVEYLEVAANLHDVGKVSVPAEILSRPSRLSALEFELVKTHVEAGYAIVSSANLPGPVAEIVYQHHERLDGSGYPRALTAPDLLMGSRVLMVADVVEAMCSHRPYRPSFGLPAALDEIAAGSATLYDADVVRACEAVVREGFVFTDEF
jgi:PAS domain S-box-containing protein/putative nucleotidyltransferase with HDIG domain